MSLDRDLRYTTAPLHERCVYARLFEARHSIADALSLGRDPLTIAARALGVERDEATIELDRLRAAGLVGDGLMLLAGGRTRRRSGSAATPAEAEAVEAVRAALASYTGSRRALARDLGCSSAALDRFVSGKGSIGAELLSALSVRLPTGTANQEGANQHPPTEAALVGTQLVGGLVGTTPPSDSPLSSLSESSLSSGFSEDHEDCGIEGVGSGAREADANRQPPTAAAPANGKQKRERSRRAKLAPPVDSIPAEGTTARRVYEAIVSDVALAPIVRGPGDLARRLAALCEGTHVDAAAEVISAGAWQLREGQWTDGAAGLMRWIKRSTDKARALPQTAPGAALTRPVAKGPLKSAEPGQFKQVDIDWSDPQPRAGGVR